MSVRERIIERILTSERLTYAQKQLIKNGDRESVVKEILERERSENRTSLRLQFCTLFGWIFVQIIFAVIVELETKVFIPLCFHNLLMMFVISNLHQSIEPQRRLNQLETLMSLHDVLGDNDVESEQN